MALVTKSSLPWDWHPTLTAIIGAQVEGLLASWANPQTRLELDHRGLEISVGGEARVVVIRTAN